MAIFDGAVLRLLGALSEFGALGSIAAVSIFVVRRLIAEAKGDPLEREQDRRLARLEHEQRVSRLFPGTRSLEEASRVRLGTLGDAFCTVEMLTLGQHLFLRHLRGEPVPCTEGAAETLRAGVKPEAVLEVMPLGCRLIAAEESGSWRTIELELEGARLSTQGGERVVQRELARWRLRLPIDRPLPGPEAIDDLDAGGWQLQSVPQQDRIRPDRVPQRLPLWGDPEKRPTRADHLAERRAAAVEGLTPAARDLEAHAGALALAVLEGSDEGIAEPLASQLTGRRRLEELIGIAVKIEDLRVESVAILDATMDARWRTALAAVELSARRWLEPGGVRPALDDRGVLLVGLARPRDDLDSGWSAYGLWPGERA